LSLFERKSFGIYYKIVFFYIIKIIILNKIKKETLVNKGHVKL